MLVGLGTQKTLQSLQKTLDSKRWEYEEEKEVPTGVARLRLLDFSRYYSR